MIFAGKKIKNTYRRVTKISIKNVFALFAALTSRI